MSVQRQSMGQGQRVLREWCEGAAPSSAHRCVRMTPGPQQSPPLSCALSIDLSRALLINLSRTRSINLSRALFINLLRLLSNLNCMYSRPYK
eukprot:359602-Chlamydomonas_euryale.AAC.18